MVCVASGIALLLDISLLTHGLTLDWLWGALLLWSFLNMNCSCSRPCRSQQNQVCSVHHNLMKAYNRCNLLVSLQRQNADIDCQQEQLIINSVFSFQFFFILNVELHSSNHYSLSVLPRAVRVWKYYATIKTTTQMIFFIFVATAREVISKILEKYYLFVRSQCFFMISWYFQCLL